MSVPTVPNIYVRPRALTESVFLYWRPPTDLGGSAIINYTVTCPAASYIESFPPTVNRITVSSLSQGIDYTFQITATNSTGTSEPATYRTVQVGLLPGGAVNVNASTTTITSAIVNWNFSTNAGEAPTHWFVLSALPSTLGIAPIIKRSAHGYELQRELFNLSPGITYQILVQAVNDVGYANPTALSQYITLGPLPLTGSWFGFASSADGTKLVTGNYNGYIYTSTDSGNSWTKRMDAGIGAWNGFASSADGTKLVTGDNNNGYIYTSTDSGVSWTQQTNAGLNSWFGFASSADGTKLVTGKYSGYIYTSTDSGYTWTERTDSGVGDWRGFASSADGTKLVTGDFSYSYGYGSIYTSTDSGETWTQQTDPGTGNWQGFACSSDGEKIVTGNSFDAGDYIYTSTDAGITWTQNTGPGIGHWSSFGSSSDGNKLLATDYNGYLYNSTDSGATWIQRTSLGPGARIAVASSSDGNKLVTGILGGAIYTSTNGGETWIMH